MMQSTPIMECWHDLANAIILKAAEDYREALHCLAMNPASTAFQAQKRDLEAFFTSQWFHVLTRLDGRQLQAALIKEAASS